MEEFLLAGLLGCCLIITCCLIIYELLRTIWTLLPRLTWPPHLRVLVVVASVFIAHILNIWLFGLVYYLLHYFGFGVLTGAAAHEGALPDIFGYLYYSAVIYSTLGLGDLSPQGALRMITGVEALTGFVLMGWTVSFTYLAMQKFWELPHRRR